MVIGGGHAPPQMDVLLAQVLKVIDTVRIVWQMLVEMVTREINFR